MFRLKFNDHISYLSVPLLFSFVSEMILFPSFSAADVVEPGPGQSQSNPYSLAESTQWMIINLLSGEAGFSGTTGTESAFRQAIQITQVLRNESRKQADLNMTVEAVLNSYLDSHQLIRVVMNSEVRFGHEMSSLRAVQRLRELGFRGNIEILYDKVDFESVKTIEKLPVLIPGFNPLLHDQMLFSPELGQVRVVSKSFFSNQRVRELQADLVISGAGQVSSQDRLMAKGDSLIQLQPMFWTGERYLEVSSGARVSLQDLSMLGIAVSERPHGEFQESLHELNSARIEQLTRTFRSSRGSKQYLENLVELLNLAPNRSELLPVYGLDKGREELKVAIRLANALIEGTSRYASRSDLAVRGPIIIPLFDRFASDTKLNELNQHELIQSGKAKILNINQANLKLKLASSPIGQIIFLHVGPVHPLILTELCRKATFPVLAEGKNFSLELMRRGQPYLNTIGIAGDIELLVGMLGAGEVRFPQGASYFSAATQALGSLSSPSSTTVLADYLFAVRDPNSEVRKFFWHDLSLRQQGYVVDPLAQALLRLKVAQKLSGVRVGGRGLHRDWRHSLPSTLKCAALF